MINELILKRRSTVLFDSRPIDDKVLFELFEAARWAPSSLNIQPWRIVYSKKGDPYYHKMFDCLNEGNREWAGNAPVLLATIAQTVSDYKNRPNAYAWHDTAMAYSNLVFQATSAGLSLHPMGGFDKKEIIEVLSIPENYEPVIMAALGIKSEDTNFPEKLLERENTRKGRKRIEEFVFHGSFNQAISI